MDCEEADFQSYSFQRMSLQHELQRVAAQHKILNYLLNADPQVVMAAQPEQDVAGVVVV